ncbi:46 kDa FK506-binding nuclear protein [Formica exsecta]|uniref:46 kDa FK506-binding nuclear protein n=1 Tax=Formica exsecta TaxID=72781 RepID=UPI001144449E|nr:46 kDa FK506-binding nuclear protein [Formica exsecta]
MFWALILEPYKRYTQCVRHTFHVTMACLDLSLAREPVQVMVKCNNKSFLLCTLNKDKFQTSLDLIFEKGENITFFCNGQGSVHMTGYLLPNENIDSDSEEEIEEEEAEEQEEEVRLNTIPEKSLKRKIESPKNKKKPKLAKQEPFESNNWDDDDDNEENNSSLEEDSDNDEDMEDEEDENDNDDEEEEQEHEHEEFTKPQKHEKKETENQRQNQQKKTHDKQNKINGEEIKQEQQSKKQKKKAEQQKNNLIEAKKRIIEGGVQVEDTNPGNGALATSGKLVTVYYVGRCKIGKEEKKVDSCTQGNGFKFRLGKGQVIKGWDVGIPGMKVGGKRRLTIPSNMGYGSKGSLPAIPGNSTLVFDIELKNVN